MPEMQDINQGIPTPDATVAPVSVLSVEVLETLGWSHRYIRFVRYHLEEFTTIYLAPTSASTRALQERLSREYATLTAGHICTCWCSLLHEQRTGNVCGECQRRRSLALKQDVAIKIGRRSPVHAPAPLTLLLDLHAGYAA